MGRVVHLLTLSVRGVWVTRVNLTVTLRVHLIHSTRVLGGNLAASGRVADRGKVRADVASVILSRGSLRRVGGLTVDLGSSSGGALPLFVSFALIVLFLLSGLPLLPYFLEFCRAQSALEETLK